LNGEEQVSNDLMVEYYSKIGELKKLKNDISEIEE
jgi:hypothetical protein